LSIDLPPAATDVAMRLQARRRVNGLSLEQAGCLLGVAHTTIRDWEHGRQPRPAHLARLAPLLQLEPACESPLRRAWISLGLALAEAATRIHVSTSTLAKWESGTRRPGNHHLRALGRALELSPRAAAALLQNQPPGRRDGPRLPGLRALRTDAGYSQRGFADALGISTATCAAWEYGRTPIPPHQLPVIAGLLDSDVDTLLTRGRAPVLYPRRRRTTLSRLRSNAGFAQRHAAVRLAISIRTLARIEAGARPISVRTAYRLAACYRIPFRDVALAAELKLQLPDAEIGEDVVDGTAPAEAVLTVSTVHCGH